MITMSFHYEETLPDIAKPLLGNVYSSNRYYQETLRRVFVDNELCFHSYNNVRT